MSTSFTSRIGTAPDESIKGPCVAATTANISLTGEQTIDGVSVVAGDRVLVRLQTDNTENGIYDASTGAWTRSTDFNAANDVISGIMVLDVNGGNLYQVTFTGDFTPGTTALTISIFGSSADAAATAADVITCDADAVATAADRVQTGLDATATAADRVQTGLDATATAADVVTADADSANATAKYTAFDQRSLGAFTTATEPTVDNLGNALITGAQYFNSDTNITMYRTTTPAWVNINTIPTSASGVSIADTGNYFTGADVETALQESGQTTSNFRPSVSSPADTLIHIAAGKVQNAFSVIEHTAQTIDYTGNFPTSAGYARVDRIVISKTTGDALKVVGVEETPASAAWAPAIPAGYYANCKVTLAVPVSTITDSIITDERAAGGAQLAEQLRDLGSDIANIRINSKGSSVFCRTWSGVFTAAMKTSGANLIYSDSGSTGTAGNGSPGTGTWLCRGRASTTTATNWLRIL